MIHVDQIEGFKMTTQDIINTAVPILKKNPLVLSCSLFGSHVKGNATSRSDVDFLLTLKHSASLFDRVEIQLELEKEMGTHVDVVSPQMLHPRIKSTILKEKVDFYEC